MKFSMIRDNRFGPFFWTQFLGAFNDNLLKFAVTLAVTYNDSLRGELSTGLLINLISALFILPFFIFSATSGQLADKFDKTKVMRLAKWLEPPIVLLTGLGFALNSVWLLTFAVFLLGAQSAFFGPAKYAYLPEHLKSSELVMANAMVETGTFMAILLGTIAAGSILSQEAGGAVVYVVCAFGMVVALLGVYSIHKAPLTQPHQPELQVNWNIFSETWRNIRAIRQIRSVWPSLLGISWLWFVGATYLTQFPLLSKTVLNASSGVATFLLFTFTVGLGLGTFLCEKLSNKRIEPGLIIWGLVLMVGAGVGLHFLLANYLHTGLVQDFVGFIAQPRHWALVVVFVLISAGIGLYSVPLYTTMQALSPLESRSRVVAANNIINSFFMVVSAGVAVAILVLSKGQVAWVFSVITLLNIAVLTLWVWRQPQALMRAILMLKVPSRKAPVLEGAEVLSQQGAFLLVFPTLLHDEYEARLASLPMRYSVVLSGVLPGSTWVAWLRKHNFVHEFSKLTETDAQRNLVKKIANEIQAGRSIAVDKAMFNLLTQKFKLSELPGLLKTKGVLMHIIQVEEKKLAQVPESSRPTLTLT